MTTPVFVEVDPAAILADVLASYEELTGKTVYPGQPEYSICTCLAYHKALTNQRINEAGKSQLLDLSTSPVIDYIAAVFNVTRLSAEPAVCTLQFSLVEGHREVVIPLGTRVASTDGEAIFATKEDITAIVGNNTVSVSAECQTPGVVGNNYAIGDISDIQDPYAYISSVENIDVTSGGSEEETDEQLRTRTKLAPSQYSVAGSRNAYIFHTKSVSSLIADVSIMTYEDDNSIAPGEVDVYALLNDGAIPSSAFNEEIQATLSKETIRPLTDTVVVKSPTEVEYSLDISIVKKPDAVGAILTSKINSMIEAYGIEHRQLLGMDIVATEIEALCRIDGIYDTTVTVTPLSGSLSGRNYIVSDSQVAKLNGVSITITGSNNG